MFPLFRRLFHDEEAFKMFLFGLTRALLLGAGVLVAVDTVTWQTLLAALLVAGGIAVPSSAVRKPPAGPVGPPGPEGPAGPIGLLVPADCPDPKP